MIPGHLRIFLARGVTDMRRSIDGLRKEAEAFGVSVDGGLFVFANRKRDRLKVLWRDKGGWCLLYKRLDAERRVVIPAADEERVRIDAQTLAFLLDGVRKKPTRDEIRQQADNKVRSILSDDRYSHRAKRRPQRTQNTA